MTASLAVSPQVVWEATRSEWSSLSWKVTHLRPPLSTYSAAPSSQQPTASRHSVPGRRTGAMSSAASLLRLMTVNPGWRKIRASDAIEAAGSSPPCILSCALIGPGSSPGASKAVRACNACSLTSSVRFDGLARGHRDSGSNTGEPATSPRCVVRRRTARDAVLNTDADTAPRGASLGHFGIARRTRGSWAHWQTPTEPRRRSVTTKTARSVTDVLI